MMSWAMRSLMLVGAMLIGGIGYGASRLTHPSMPDGWVNLASAPAAAGGVTARFFGTTSLAFSDGRNTVLIDALLSRPGLSHVLLGKVGPDAARVTAILRRASISHADLLLITHTHYDHVLDAPEIARETGVTIVGSPSTREVALGGGIADRQIVTVHGGETLHAGDFTITVFKSAHSAGDRVPGDVTSPLLPPAPVTAYKEGGTLAYLIEHHGLRILVHASANVVPGMYRGVHADIAFLALGGLSSQSGDVTTRYWQETVEATGARLVVPIHWDDFLAPLDQPLKPLRRFMDNIPLTATRVAPLAAHDGVVIRTMPAIAPVDLEAAAGTRAPTSR